MVAISENSKLYDDIFKGENVPDTFESKFPSYADLTNGFLDPSYAAMRLSKDRINGDQAKDLRESSRILLKDLTRDLGDSDVVNFPSTLIDGLFNVIKSKSVGTQLSDSDVLNKIVSVPAANTSGIGGVGGLVIGGALLTLSVTVPLLGTIASAIVGIAAGIAKAVKTNNEKKDINEAGVRAALYKTFPPMQTAGSETDSAIVQTMGSVFRTNDWTDIYAPRFKGDWVGLPRTGGYAFAPGSIEKDMDTFEADVNEKFIPTGGFGVIPGTNIVTSVIQVSLSTNPEDPYSKPFQDYMKKEGSEKARVDPRTFKDAWSRTQDVGLYYQTTGKVGSMWWELALQEGNWYKFRIDSKRLHEEWKNYCEGGLAFIRNKCYKWIPGDLNSDYENYFGTGIFYGIGAWSGNVAGGTANHPKYQVFNKPFGNVREQLVFPDLYKRGSGINSSRSGAFLPLSAITDKNGNFINDWWCDSCMGTIYERGYDIKSKLDDLKKRQEWDLYGSLACAYCSQFDSAFQNDEKLETLLLKRRKVLLNHPDRYYVNINDVLTDEPGLEGIKNQESWRQQLLDSGVPLIPKKPPMKGPGSKLSMGNDIPPGLKPPTDPGIDPGPVNPWDPKFTIGGKKVSTKTSSSGNGLVLLGGLGFAAYLMKTKRT